MDPREIRRALLYTVKAVSLRMTSSLKGGLVTLKMASTVTICRTNLGTLNPETTGIFDIDVSSAAAELLNAFPT